MARVFSRAGTWYLEWRDALGRHRRRASNATGKREAQALLAELVAQAERVRLGLEEAPAESRLTLKQLLDWWVQERCPEASKENAERSLRKHVLSTELAAYPLPAITPDLLEAKVFQVMERVRTVRTKKGLVEQPPNAPATINRVRGMLHAAFEAAQKPPRKWSGRNPVSSTSNRHVPRVDRRTLNPEEVRLVLAQVPEQWRGVMATAAYLGLRRGEIFALKKSDYDRERQTLRVAASNQRDTTKTGRRDTLPVPSLLRPYLDRARRTPGFWLFGDVDGVQRTREADPHVVLRRALARLGIAQSWWSYCLRCKRAGRTSEVISETKPEPSRCAIDGKWRRVKVHKQLAIRFHDLRHSCATNLLKAGVPLAHVARILRHSSIRITNDTYGHLDNEDLRAALETPNNLSQSSQAVRAVHAQITPKEPTDA